MGEYGEHREIGIVIDGKFQEVSCPSIGVRSCTFDDDADFDKMFGTVSLNIDFCPEKGLTLDDVAIVLLGIASAEQVKQNNWRKLHGLPMKRRMNR